MKWLLDTNVVSETGRARPDSSVLAWLSARAPDQLAISIALDYEANDYAALVGMAVLLFFTLLYFIVKAIRKPGANA